MTNQYHEPDPCDCPLCKMLMELDEQEQECCIDCGSLNIEEGTCLDCQAKDLILSCEVQGCPYRIDGDCHGECEA